jgi:large subunit ribosomal protein L32e
MAEKKKETKTENKPQETKAETKTEKKVEAKVETKVETKKYIPYVKKENKKKSNEAFNLQKKLLTKKATPTFRGRFGKKNIRRKSIEKWDKWRKPHGIDLDKGINHGREPRIGFRREKETRHVHPSGYKEVLICNMNDLAKVEVKTQAARLSRTLGKRKRNEIVKKANEKGIWVLN